MTDILERAEEEVDAISREDLPQRRQRESNSRDLMNTLQLIGRKGDLARTFAIACSRCSGSRDSSARCSASAGNNKELRGRVRTLGPLSRVVGRSLVVLSQKITFLLDATLGMINIEQSNIIKIFSIAAGVFLPPTLIASIYGMNFALMPELRWPYGYPLAWRADAGVGGRAVLVLQAARLALAARRLARVGAPVRCRTRASLQGAAAPSTIQSSAATPSRSASAASAGPRQSRAVAQAAAVAASRPTTVTDNSECSTGWPRTRVEDVAEAAAAAVEEVPVRAARDDHRRRSAGMRSVGPAAPPVDGCSTPIRQGVSSGLAAASDDLAADSAR